MQKKTQGEFVYSDFKDIDWELFYDIIWADFISDLAVSDAWLNKNTEFVTEITIESYRIFKLSNKLTIRDCAKLIESFIIMSFKFKPSQENIHDKNSFNFFS